MSGGRIEPADLRHLERCLELAAEGRWRAAPNPQVGALLVRDGEVIGEGHHQRAGGPHAEIHALKAVTDTGASARGATLYVNLEPCDHEGRTPPCAQAVIDAGVERVVCGLRDPNPVAEGGAGRLRRAGVTVDFLDAANTTEETLLRRALAQNARFLVPIVRRRPMVTLKWAMTLDGKIATRTGESQWISSPEGREWALEQREKHDAILVGSGTALEDDPRLTRRLGHAEGHIARVVMDRRLRLSAQSALFTEPGPVFIYTEAQGASASSGRIDAIRRAGGIVVELERCEPEAVLADLGTRGVSSVLIEGGGVILGSFLDAGMVDRIGVCCAPKLFGGAEAAGPISGLGIDRIEDALLLGERSVERRGCDVIIEGTEERCLRDLLSSVARS